MEKRIKVQAQEATRTGSVRRFDDLGRIVVPPRDSQAHGV